MKYFIEGRERKIYFTKDNTAFYKSKGNNVDVTYMFKKTKNGLELRKKYLKTDKKAGKKTKKGGTNEDLKKKIAGFFEKLKTAIDTISDEDIERINKQEALDIYNNLMHGDAEKANKALDDIACINNIATKLIIVLNKIKEEIKKITEEDLTTDISYLKKIFAGDTANYNYMFITNVVEHLNSGDEWWYRKNVDRNTIDFTTALTSKMSLIENLYRVNSYFGSKRSQSIIITKAPESESDKATNEAAGAVEAPDVAPDGTAKKTVLGGYKKTNKKTDKKTDKNTDSKSTKKASKKTKK